METSDNELEAIYEDIRAIKKQVNVLQGGWEHLTRSNDDLASRMESIAQTSSRMESWHRDEKAVGKSIAGTSSDDTQVSHPVSPANLESDTLCYRGITNSLENESNLLKKKWIYRILWE